MLGLIWFFSSLGVVALIYGTYQKRSSGDDHAATGVLLGLSTCLFFWLVCLLFAELCLDPSKIIFFHELKYIPLLSIPGILLSFSFAHLRGEIERGLLHKLFLILIPVVLIGFIMTDHWHHWFRKEIYVIIGSVNNVQVVNGFLYRIVMFYTYGILISAIMVLVIYIRRQPTIYGRREMVVVIGTLLSMAANISYQFMQVRLGTSFDATPLTFGLVSVMFYYSYFIYQPDLLKFVKAYVKGEQGILFIDRDQDRIYVNGRFKEDTGCEDMPHGACSYDQLSPTMVNAINQAQISGEKGILRTAKSGLLRVYEIQVERKYDGKQRFLGTLVTLKNMTEAHRDLENKKMKSLLNTSYNL